MYPAGFSYQRATSVQDAIARLAKEPDAKLLAGGHSLLPPMKLRLASPSTLVDLGGLQELRGIRRDGDTIAIGALTTHREIEFSKELKAACPILPEAAALIGDPLVRNRGTIGGSVAHADPAADFPAVLLALGATIQVEGPKGRTNDCRRRLLHRPVHDGASARRIADRASACRPRSRRAPAWPTRSSRIRRRATRSSAWRPWCSVDGGVCRTARVALHRRRVARHASAVAGSGARWQAAGRADARGRVSERDRARRSARAISSHRASIARISRPCCRAARSLAPPHARGASCATPCTRRAQLPEEGAAPDAAPMELT